jgi:hypothetical protein
VRPRLIAALLGLSTACGQAPAPPPAPTPEAPADEDPPAPTQRLVRPGPGCSVHGWCWDHPEVQGNTLRGVVFTADGGWLAVGDRGTVLRRGPDGAYALEDPGTRERLRDVARAEDVIVAVGEGGTMLQREPAGDWTPLESPAPAELRAVALSPRRELAAVGAGGELVLGTLGGELRLERIEGEGSRLVDVAWTEDGSLYLLGVEAPGDDGLLAVVHRRRRGGDTFAAERLRADYAALTPFGRSVALAGRASRLDGRTVRLDRELRRPVEALVGVAGALYAVGVDAGVARFDGRRWRRIDAEVAAGRDLLAAAARVREDGTEELVAVGDGGLGLSVVGDAVELIAGRGELLHLQAVVGVGEGSDELWAVGDGGVLHLVDGTWSRDGPETELHGLWSPGDGTLWAAGHGGQLLRHAGGGWRTVRRGGEETELHAIWGTGPDFALVVGKDRWLEIGPGEAVREITGPRPVAAGVWGSARDDIWVVGRDGIFHVVGDAITPGPEGAFFDVWGAAADDVWAVGAEGGLAHWDGDAWTRVEAPTRLNLLAVWGSGSDDVWAVGDGGTILHYDGAAWRWRDSGTDGILHGVWGTGPEDVVVVGHDGAVLRFRGYATAPIGA